MAPSLPSTGMWWWWPIWLLLSPALVSPTSAATALRTRASIHVLSISEGSKASGRSPVSTRLNGLFFTQQHSSLPVRSKTLEMLRRKADEGSRTQEEYDYNYSDIEFEYDLFTRRAALATLGLWGVLGAQQTKEYLTDMNGQRDARAFLSDVAVKPDEARASGIPTLLYFHQEGQVTDIRHRIANPLRGASGPKKINFVDVDVSNVRVLPLLERYGVFTTPTLVWLDGENRLNGAATGDLPEGLIEVNTQCLVKGERLPYARAVLPGADIIDNPVYNTIESGRQSQKVYLDDTLESLPSATPMDYDS